MNYIREPDVFHDDYGKVGIKALARDELHYLARLYWYTVEFGLIGGPERLQIYGAGILSSPAECRFALEDRSPNRIAFDLPRIIRTSYRIDDFQQTYFVIESFEQLLEETTKNLAGAVERAGNITADFLGVFGRTDFHRAYRATRQ